MGISIVGECSQCDYKKEFFVGSGMLCEPIRSRYKEKPIILNEFILPEHKSEMLEFIELADQVKQAAMYKVYHCQNCYHIEDKYYYEVQMDDIELIPTYVCNKCGEPMNPLEPDSHIETPLSCINARCNCHNCFSDNECVYFLSHITLNCPICKNKSVTWKAGTWDWD